jgi:hypothetical protein
MGRREAFAKWVVSPENPLFAKVIANRLWKKLMGVGLIEPVDAIEGQEADMPELLEFLADEMVRMDFNMKQFLRMLLNTDVYQRRAVFKDYDETAYYFPGPTLRRMTAEQIWDSLVTLSTDNWEAVLYDELNPYRFPQLDVETASAQEIVEMGTQLFAERQAPKKTVASSTAVRLPRASEMRQPSPQGHFLRDFGQSDRELIDGANTDPTVSQILTLVNGRHHFQIIREGSLLTELLKTVQKVPHTRARVIYLSILGREPSREERALALTLFETLKQPRRGNNELVWILLNTPEFMFIQ